MTQITIRGDIEPRAIEQLTRCAEQGDAPLAAACADAHVGYSLCVGGVVGYRDYVSPSGVGYDIGCGNMAVKTDILVDDIGGPVGECREAQTDWAAHKPESSGARKNEAPARAYSNDRAPNAISRVMDEIVKRVDFGMGTRPGNEADHPVLEQIAQADFVPQRGLAQLARDQLGTVGSGNHYVDLFRDEDGWLWIGVHFGSRGFGHKTATGFLAIAAELERRTRQPFDVLTRSGTAPDIDSFFNEKSSDGEMDAPPTLLRTNHEIGQSYVAAMELAGAYAYAGREVVVQRVLDILGAKAVDTVHNHHNFAWLEDHYVDGKKEQLWVVRKGATPAFPGQRGFVGATMGEPAVILEGAEPPPPKSTESDYFAQRGLLFSTVHGAGRLMSRNKAAGKWRKRWECGDRDCHLEIPTATPNQTPGKGACSLHPQARPRKVRKRVGGAIDWNETRTDLRAKGIELRGAAADEAPGAYKRLSDVLDYHRGTVNILHTLTPIGVAMAASDTPDAYKD